MLATFTPVLAAGIMDIRPGLTIWTALTFLLLLVVLSRFAWGPIVRTLEERERTIREAVEQARKERSEAERMLAQQTASLTSAQREAAALAHKSRQEVEVLRQQLTAQARAEAEALIASAKQQIQEERAKAVAELRTQVVDLAIDAARRLVKSSLDERTQRALVEEYIAKLPADAATTAPPPSAVRPA